MFTLNLTFTKASGKKHTVKITGAKETQNPTDVKALMQHMVNNNILHTKGDALVGIAEAKLQKTVETEIVL